MTPPPEAASSVDLESQAAATVGGASSADLLTHRHPSSAANGTAAAAAASGDRPPADDGSKSIAGNSQGEDTPDEEAVTIKPASYLEIAKHFGILGWTAFGGPAAHITMFLRVRLFIGGRSVGRDGQLHRGNSRKAQ